MKPFRKAILESTGLTLQEFCERHLNSKYVTFSARLSKNRLYPNEMLYICQVTGKPFSELFPGNFTTNLLLRGDPMVTLKLMIHVQDQAGWDKLMDLLDVDMMEKPTIQESIIEPTEVEYEEPEQPKTVKNVIPAPVPQTPGPKTPPPPAPQPPPPAAEESDAEYVESY